MTVMDSRIFRELRIKGNVLCIGKELHYRGCRTTFVDDSNRSFDWVYYRGPIELHSQSISTDRLYAMCDRSKHVAIVYHTRQSGLLENGRFHHKRSTIDNAIRDRLVFSKMFGNYYVAVLAKTNAVSDWKFVTVEDLSSATLSLIPNIPNGVSSVVSMHRSGSVPAAMLAAVLHVPCHIYSDKTGLIETRGGGRTSEMQESGSYRLVIDDTVSSGKSIQRAKQWFRKNDPSRRYLFAAIFASPHGAIELDFFAKTLRTPHLLEWNFLNSNHSQNMAVDLDGVLCYDPPDFDETNDEGRAQYLEWIRNAKVKYPARWGPLSAIVSYRCEYTRNATEAWLEESGIRFDRLLLFPGEPQDRTFKASQWKGKFYKSSPHRLFVESSSRQAYSIREFTNKAVLDIENKQMLGVLQ